MQPNPQHNSCFHCAFRLCPLNQKITEESFQQQPIPFARKMSLEFGNGSRLDIPGRYLSEGTTPPGSVWAVNPLPFGTASLPIQFRPPCGDSDASRKDDTGECSGRFPIGVSIVDTLVEPGEYVLGFRYDCETTAQVLSSCADITIRHRHPRGESENINSNSNSNSNSSQQPAV